MTIGSCDSRHHFIRHFFSFVALLLPDMTSSALNPSTSPSMTTKTPTTNTRLLRPWDVPAIAELLHNPGIGWEQTSDDLLRIVQGPGRAWGTFTAHDGPLISMASLPTFGDAGPTTDQYNHREEGSIIGQRGANDEKWGWLAYVATHPDHRRRGYASSLVRILLADDAVDFPVGLYGSSAGARLYRSFGFETRGYAQLVQTEGGGLAGADIGKLTSGRSFGNAARRRRIRVEGHDDDLLLVPASDALSELQRLDADIYGPGRECDVRRWANDVPTAAVSSSADWGCSSFALLSEGDDTANRRSCVGYVLSRPMHPSGTFLGPVVASTRSEAEILVRAAVASAPRGAAVRMLLLPSVVDIGVVEEDGNEEGEGSRTAEEFHAVASSLGFRCLGETPSRLMIRGGEGDGVEGGGIPWTERCRLWSSSAGRHNESSGSSATVVRVARPFAATGYEFG